MESISDIGVWLRSLENDPETIRLVFIFLLGTLGFMLSLALSFFARALFDPVKRRVDTVQREDSNPQNRGKSRGTISVVGDWIAPKAEEKKSAVLLRLEQAGYRSSQAFAIFFGSKLLAFVAAPLLLTGVIVLFAPGAVFDRLWLIILSGVVAFNMPDLWLSKAVRRRQKHLRHALPDALDLMVVCAEAGLGLNAAIKRVADDIGVQHPELADELQLVMMQTRAGMDSRAALKELERRTGLDDIKAFVTTLLQAMRFGTSISDSLRVFAEDMRDKRLQRAQEIAARLSLTMLMPIALCMLPMFLLIVLGPSVLVLTNIVPALSGGG